MCSDIMCQFVKVTPSYHPKDNEIFIFMANILILKVTPKSTENIVCLFKKKKSYKFPILNPLLKATHELKCYKIN